MASERKRIIRRAATNDDGIDPRATPMAVDIATRTIAVLFTMLPGRSLGNDTRGYLHPRHLSRRNFPSEEREGEGEEKARKIENGRRVAERRNHPRAALRIDCKLGSRVLVPRSMSFQTIFLICSRCLRMPAPAPRTPVCT